MIDYLVSLGEGLQVFIDFVVNLVTNLLSIIQIIPDSLHAITYAVSYMPSALAVFATAGISICVVFHIVGR